MSAHTFNSPGFGPYSFDHQAKALQDYHAAQRAREERQDRAERWLADRLSGLTFASFETLTTTALNTFQNYAGRLATEDERRVLEDASRCLWAGVSLRQRTALELDAVGYVQALTFKAA
jgi:hypothetical protein